MTQILGLYFLLSSYEHMIKSKSITRMLYLSPYCNPSARPLTCKLAGTEEQTGWYHFYTKGKKFQLVKPGAQLSITFAYYHTVKTLPFQYKAQNHFQKADTFGDRAILPCFLHSLPF